MQSNWILVKLLFMSISINISREKRPNTSIHRACSMTSYALASCYWVSFYRLKIATSNRTENMKEEQRMFFALWRGKPHYHIFIHHHYNTLFSCCIKYTIMYTHLSRKNAIILLLMVFCLWLSVNLVLKYRFVCCVCVCCRSVAHRSTENSMLSNFTLHKALHTLSLLRSVWILDVFLVLSDKLRLNYTIYLFSLLYECSFGTSVPSTIAHSHVKHTHTQPPFVRNSILKHSHLKLIQNKLKLNMLEFYIMFHLRYLFPSAAAAAEREQERETFPSHQPNDENIKWYSLLPFRSFMHIESTVLDTR